MDKDLQNLLCGGVAGCASRTAVAPLERLKILFQVQDYLAQSAKSTASSSSTPAMATAAPPKYNGVWQSLRRIGAEEGLRGYFRGNGANCARVFPYTAIQFATFERMKPLLLPAHETHLSPMRKLVGGAVAGVVSVVLTYPLDFVRARLTVQGSSSFVGPKYTGIYDALRRTYSAEGVRGLYRGVTPTVMGVAPYVGLNFMVFETLRSNVPRDARGDPNAWYILGCGAVAGACGQTAAYPMDLLRRRFQVSSMRATGSTTGYTSTLGSLRAIVQQDGVLGLYKGLWPNFLKVVPSIAIMFTTNELLKRTLADVESRRATTAATATAERVVLKA